MSPSVSEDANVISNAAARCLQRHSVVKEVLREKCMHANLAMWSSHGCLTNVHLDQCLYLKITPFMTGFKALVTGKLCHLFPYDGSLSVWNCYIMHNLLALFWTSDRYVKFMWGPLIKKSLRTLGRADWTCWIRQSVRERVAVMQSILSVDLCRNSWFSILNSGLC